MSTQDYPRPAPRPTSPLDKIHNGAWLDVQKFPPLQWAVPGLIAEGMGFVIGPPKLGKSWFVLGIGLAVASGGKALGKIPVQARPVLYAALEDGNRRMQSRARSLTGGEGIPERFEYFTSAVDPADVYQTIEAWLNTHEGGLVMLDTLGKVLHSAGPGQSAYERDYAVGAYLKAIADRHPGSALLVVHHSRKMGSSDFMDATSGTNGLNGAADYTIVLERSRGDNGALIKVTGRDVTENEYAANMAEGSWYLTGDDLAESASMAQTERATKSLGDDAATVYEYVAAHSEGVSPSQVATLMGWPNDKAGKYLKRLFEQGRITNPARGQYAPYSSVQSGKSVQTTTDTSPQLDALDTLDTPIQGKQDGRDQTDYLAQGRRLREQVLGETA
ncbi:AAA family ATPase [Ancrocorticia sp.]|uniref:AAA family ATPase n=1 Tax=Ancrocorticia sp. TaxID=2593684 RepID=UPI003F90DF29